ncbi:MAG: chemotaxis protein CheW [bacterium]
MTSESEEKPKIDPLVLLQDYERRSLIHSVGIPEQATVKGAWSGISFRVKGYQLISNINEVTEIIQSNELTRVPGAKEWMLGIANVRGNLIPVVDLRSYLVGEKTIWNDSVRILVAKQGNAGVGLVVEEVLGQKHFVESDATESPVELDDSLNKYVEGAFVLGEDVWSIFHMDRLIVDPEFMYAAA